MATATARPLQPPQPEPLLQTRALPTAMATEQTNVETLKHIKKSRPIGRFFCTKEFRISPFEDKTGARQYMKEIF